jgi:hypothetical protein
MSPELLALRLGPFEIGDVVDVGHEAAHPAVLTHVGHVGAAHVAQLAITVGQLALEGDETAGERSPHVRCDGRVRHVTEDLADGAPEVLLHGATEPVLVGEVVEAVAFVDVDVADQGWDRLDDELESCVTVHRGTAGKSYLQWGRSPKCSHPAASRPDPLSVSRPSEAREALLSVSLPLCFHCVGSSILMLADARWPSWPRMVDSERRA